MGVQMHAWRLGNSLWRWAYFPPLAVCHCEGRASWLSKLLAIPLPQPPVSPTECGGDRQGLCPGFHVGSGDPNPGFHPVWQVSCPWRGQTSLRHGNLEPQ